MILWRTAPRIHEDGLDDCLIRIRDNVLIALGTQTSEHRRIGSVGANLVRSFRDHAHVSPIVVERPILGAGQSSADDADDVIALSFSPGYSHKEQKALHESNGRPSILAALTMVAIIFSNLVWVMECLGRRGEIDAMPFDVGPLLVGIPLESHGRLYVNGAYGQSAVPHAMSGASTHPRPYRAHVQIVQQMLHLVHELQLVMAGFGTGS